MIACSVAFIHRLTSAASVVAVAFGLVACKQETKRSENPPTVVQVETVTLTEYAPTVRLTGDIRAEVESDLSFRVSGRIIERTVDVGDHVTADQVLARLDPQQQQATVTAAEAAVQAAEAVLRQATSTYERQKALLAKGFTTKRDHDAGRGSLPHGPSLARCGTGPAWHSPRPAFLHRPAGGRSRRHHRPQCRDGAGRAGRTERFLDRAGRPARRGVPRLRVDLHQRTRRARHRADAGVRSGCEGKGHRSRGLSDGGGVQRNRQGQGRHREIRRQR